MLFYSFLVDFSYNLNSRFRQKEEGGKKLSILSKVFLLVLLMLSLIYSYLDHNT